MVSLLPTALTLNSLRQSLTRAAQRRTMSSTPASAVPAPTASTSSALPSSAPKVARSARGRPTDDPDTRHSKTLSYILRHGAAKESLVLRPDGFVRVEQLVRPPPFLSSGARGADVEQIRRPKLKELDMVTLERIVRENAKQRFTMREEPTGEGGVAELWIRANQGHSVDVSLRAVVVEKARLIFCAQVEALELKKVERAEDVPVVVHGSYFRLWDVICTSKCSLRVVWELTQCPPQRRKVSKS